MTKKRKGAFITIGIGALFLAISLFIWRTQTQGFWADKQSEFFIVGLIMVLAGLAIIFKKSINFG